MKKIFLLATAALLTACQSANSPAPAQPSPTVANRRTEPGVMRLDKSNRGEIKMDSARTMKKQDFSASDRTGLTLVYFSKTVCDACAKQAPAWEFVSAHVPEGAQVKKVLEHEVDLDWYGVMTHPTFILFRDGREIWRYVGIAAAYQLTDAIKRNRY